MADLIQINGYDWRTSDELREKKEVSESKMDKITEMVLKAGVDQTGVDDRE